MRNNSVVIMAGLRTRLRRAYERQQEWKMLRLNQWMLLFSALYLAILCTTIDPAGCRRRDDVALFHSMGQKSFTVAAVLTDSCTWCGQIPDGVQ